MSSVSISSGDVSSIPAQNDLPELHDLRFEATSLAEMNSESMPWLWPERIPTGAVTLFCGDPEIGKSFATLDIAARVSSGAAWPEEDGTKGGWKEGKKIQQPVSHESERSGDERKESLAAPLGSNPETDSSDSTIINHNSSLRVPGSVLLLSAEDNAKQTILPRLQSMNADLSKIHMLRSIRCGNGESTFSLARDIQELEYAAMTLGDCKLIVIDPITSYLQGAAWTNAVMIRTVLDPLKGLAERTGAAVILVNHLNKKGNGESIYRSIGSISIIGMTRVAWAFARSPEKPEQRWMLPLKNNLSQSARGISYSIQDGRVEWDMRPVQVSANDALDVNRRDRKENALSHATDWLHQRLISGREEIRDKIEDEAQLLGISSATLRRAREKLGVVCKLHDKHGKWIWQLPVSEIDSLMQDLFKNDSI